MKTVVETIRTHKPDLSFQVLWYRGINVDTIPGRPLGPTSSLWSSQKIFANNAAKLVRAGQGTCANPFVVLFRPSIIAIDSGSSRKRAARITPFLLRVDYEKEYQVK